MTNQATEKGTSATPERIAYGVAELAGMLGTTRTSIHRWIKSGQLKALRIGGRTFVLAESLNLSPRQGAAE